MPIKIEIVDHQNFRALSEDEALRIENAVRRVLTDHEQHDAELSIAVLDDSAIREHNRKYLQHDWPTDVISFQLSDSAERLEGQLLISRQTADAVAAELPWDGTVELMLYAIHGTLHLLGYDDNTDGDLELIRQMERQYLKVEGVLHADQHPHFAERIKIDGDTLKENNG